MHRLSPSKGQQALWLSCQHPPTNICYNNLAYFSIKGQLNISALERALQRLPFQHCALRMNYYSENEKCTCSPSKSKTRILDIHQLKHLSDCKQEEIIALHFSEEQSIPFNLSSELLIRARLLILSASEYRLILNVHHLAADAWSISLVIKQLNKNYVCHDESLSLKASSPTTPESQTCNPDYLTYLEHKHYQLSERKEQKLNLFWRNNLKHYQFPLKSPNFRNSYSHSPSHLPEENETYVRISYPFSSAQNDSIQAYCVKEQCTPFMLLQSLFSLALAKVLNIYDIVMCTPANGRTDYRCHHLVGHFCNLVCLRSKFTTQFPLKEHIQKSKAMILEALSHQELPFSTVVSTLNPQRLSDGNSFNQILFTFQSNPHELLELKGTRSKPLSCPIPSPIFPIEITMKEKSRAYTLELFSNGDYLSKQALERIRLIIENIISSELSTLLYSMKKTTD